MVWIQIKTLPYFVQKIGDDNMDLLKQDNAREFNGIYRGLVVDNNDPQKLGRIKVKIFPMFYNLDSKLLPWAVPAFPLFSGAGSDSGSFCVPNVDSYVFVFFECFHYDQPVYFAEAQTAQKGIPVEIQVNYPNRKVYKSGAGITVYIDDTSKEVRVFVPTGGKVVIESDDIHLGDETGDSLIKVSDVTEGKILSAGSGSPVTWNPVAVIKGTQKVKGA
jgi:hypothetical protein